MSIGPFTVFNKFKLKVAKGNYNLSSDGIKAALLTNAVTMLANFAGTSTNAQFSDLTSEASGTGYAAGGNVLNSVTWTDTTNSGTSIFLSNAASWTGSTLTAKYLVFYDNTTANKDLIGFEDLETSNAIGVSSASGNFTVTPNAAGWFSLS